MRSMIRVVLVIVVGISTGLGIGLFLDTFDAQALDMADWLDPTAMLVMQPTSSTTVFENDYLTGEMLRCHRTSSDTGTASACTTPYTR